MLLGTKSYELSVDIWSAGAIFAEMFKRRPIFLGDSEIDQIFKIFQILGTPDENVWPGVNSLKDFKQTFPKFRGKKWQEVIGNVDPQAIDLIS